MPYKVHFGIVLFAQPFCQSIYGFSVPNVKLASKLTILYFDLHFAQILALFATFKAATIHLCLTKYISGIDLFYQPWFQFIYGFTVLQMEN